MKGSVAMNERVCSGHLLGKERRGRHCCWCLCVFAVFWSTIGCNRNTGPARYDLSGSITYDGKPVPVGSILFAPDTSKGNDGPGASADIIDGVYRTRKNDGTVGGPHVATISGYEKKEGQLSPIESPMGKPLFMNVRINLDLPKQTATHDIAIPPQKAK